MELNSETSEKALLNWLVWSQERKPTDQLPLWLRYRDNARRNLAGLDDDELDLRIDSLGGPFELTDRIKRRVHAWRDVSDPSADELDSIIDDLVAMAEKVERDRGNPSVGRCTICAREVDGSTRAKRLHTLHGTTIKACNACRVSWDQERKRPDADIHRWSEKRRRAIRPA
jgi:hypothetical protein